MGIINSVQKTAWQKQFYNMDEHNLPSFVNHNQLWVRGVKALAAGTIGIIKAEGHQLIAKVFADGVRLWQRGKWTPMMKIDYVPVAEVLGWNDKN